MYVYEGVHERRWVTLYLRELHLFAEKKIVRAQRDEHGRNIVIFLAALWLLVNSMCTCLGACCVRKVCFCAFYFCALSVIILLF